MHTSSSLFLKEHLRIARVLSGCSQGVFICLSRNCISEPAFWGKKDRWRESMLKEKLCWQLLQHLQNHGSSTVILPVVLNDTVLCCTCFLCHRFVVSDSQRSQSWWRISSCVQEWAVNAIERMCFSRHLQFIKWCPDMLSLSCSGPGHHVLYQSVNLLSCHIWSHCCPVRVEASHFYGCGVLVYLGKQWPEGRKVWMKVKDAVAECYSSAGRLWLPTDIVVWLFPSAGCQNLCTASHIVTFCAQ